MMIMMVYDTSNNVSTVHDIDLTKVSLFMLSISEIIVAAESRKHINYKEVATEMRAKGIHLVFRQREKELKKEFKLKVLDENQLNLIADINSDPDEKNKIMTGFHEKFKILKDYLFKVVSISVIIS
jgi:hypothetical protein